MDYDKQELTEGLRSAIRQRLNQYAYEKGIHPSPGWVKTPRAKTELAAKSAKHFALSLIGQEPKKPAKPVKPRIQQSSKPNKRLTKHQKEWLANRNRSTSIDRSTNPYYVPGTNR